MILVNIVCVKCGKSFPAELESLKTLKISDMPRACPECLDKKQNRPTETISRTCHYETPVRIGRGIPQGKEKLCCRDYQETTGDGKAWWWRLPD